MRQKEGLSDYTWEKVENDNTLYGLEELLRYLENLNSEEKIKRAKLIWKELGNLYERRRESVFSCVYSWGYAKLTRNPKFDAYFIRILNKTAWIPDSEGNLQTPDNIIFSSLNWDDNHFLRSKIQFKSIDENERLKHENEQLRDDKERLQLEIERLKAKYEASFESDQSTQPQTEINSSSSSNDTSVNTFQPNSNQQNNYSNNPINQNTKTINGSDGFNPSITPDKAPIRLEPYNPTDITQPSNNHQNNYSNTNNYSQKYKDDLGKWGEDYVQRILEKEFSSMEINNITAEPIKGADFEIRNKENNELIRLVEVKTTTYTKVAYHFITGNEWEKAKDNGDKYWIYCVYNAGKDTVHYIPIQNPVKQSAEGKISVIPSEYKMRLL